MLEQIAQWKSVRKFLPQPVEREKILAIMRAGRRAPSWKNIQSWKFIAMTGDEDKEVLAAGFSMKKLITKAPAVILCVGTLKSWERSHQRDCLKELLANTGIILESEEIEKKFLNNDIAKSFAQKNSSLVARTFENIGIAYGFMILEAMNQGLGACIVGEIANELAEVDSIKYQKIKSQFGLDDSEIITAAIILGYPAQESVVSPRKSEEEIFEFRQ
ncbi:nitroreductase [Sporomusaceae bacterium BoRhaA]|uniref:nitroreductase family protein n=1 Tax=Pelorhabdus rhamnosifermentans TaxID=2772457 RepID=UPI001C05FC63|nr:nitroreductase family protein [Pelorhabdus rhamnosifermentans]MBU2701783.1 nitroreductase [Pelorhabdus rhamnosifermentans]